MESRVLVSVSVVTYNHKDYIKQCLDGILMQQTNFPFEVILGEDESNDGTREICKTYAVQYPNKIRLFLRSRKDVIYINGRPTGRFNMIENLKACKGKYIALCEGDDYWTDPLKLQKEVDFLESRQDIDVCFTQAQILSGNKLTSHRIEPKYIETPFAYYILLEQNNFITTASVLFRRPLNFELPDWFKSLPYGDMGLYKLLSNSNNFYGLKDVTTVYRIHADGLYSGVEKLSSRRTYYTFYKKIYPYLNAKESKVSIIKMNQLSKEIAQLRFPKASFYRRLYHFYLKLKG